MATEIMIAVIAGLVLLVVGSIVSIIGWLLIRVLRNVDQNQQTLSKSLSDLWVSHDKLSEDFHEIKGAHKVNHPTKLVHVHERKDDKGEE